MNYKTLSIITFLIFNFIPFSEAQNAETLLQNMDKLMSAPKDRVATVEMTVTNKFEDEKVREAILKQKGTDRKMYRYTKPEKKAGIATLSLPDDIMWLYMPSFGKPIKISLLSKSQAFTGTDFSYEDMSGIPYSERYIPKLLNPDTPNTYMLELTPRTNKTTYSKIVISIDKTHYYPVKMAFFDLDKNYEKLATYKYAKKGNYWYAQEVIMEDLQKSHSTKIVMKDIKFDQGLKDEEFEVEKLISN
ncbi:outer membrane lipoprotein-sorting protein [Formosa maritima]|uniref:Outer membrane lipoprotein-sorting protein n=1 Tax=Formosa maritima TaxID=2592046 RepID=A0A5D0G669_9FLAO|nr:outer membrane lipoprotein-sorting protein [Formosa maritima]TYA53809.1 outer membrane lipoprotein-sorting protein [Formosa maritima]